MTAAVPDPLKERRKRRAPALTVIKRKRPEGLAKRRARPPAPQRVDRFPAAQIALARAALIVG